MASQGEGQARKVTIRRAGVADVPLLVALSDGLFQEDAGQRDPFMNLAWPRQEGNGYFSQRVRDERCLPLLALVQGEAVGYLLGYLKPPSTLRPVRVAELESMYVKPGRRSQGIGQRLVDRFLSWARGQGAKRVSVTAYAANERALAFYRRNGFVPKSVTLERGL